MATTNGKALLLHEEWKGKLGTVPRAKVAFREDLAPAYMLGVAKSCKAIAQDPETAYPYTIRSNTTAVVPDGSAVFGLGNIGPLATIPVMEGESVPSKELGGVNAFSICLDTQDTEEVAETVVCITSAFGGTNLEDIAASCCFETEEALKERLDIPIFHDDQHGTAIVVLTDVINALKVTGRRKEEYRVVVSGAGSAGVAIIELFLAYGFSNIIMCDKPGILHKGAGGFNWMQKKMADMTSLERRIGFLADAMKDVDILIGASASGIITSDMVASMNKDAIMLAMVNPTPETMSDLAEATGTRVVDTGCSDFPNQVNNVVIFPGTLKGVLEGRATATTEETRLAAVNATAGLVDEKDPNEDNILPEAFDPRVARMVGQTVKDHI